MCIKIVFSQVLSIQICISIFIREHFNKNDAISVHYFNSFKLDMLIFIPVGKVVLLVCIKSALMMSFRTRTINKTLIIERNLKN